MSQITLTQYVEQQRAKAEERALQAERLLLLMCACVPVELHCAPLRLSPTELRILQQRNVVGYELRRGIHAVAASCEQASWKPGVVPAVGMEELEALRSKAKKELSSQVWATICNADNTERLQRGRWAVVELLGHVREVFVDTLLEELDRADVCSEHKNYADTLRDLLPPRYDMRHRLKEMVRYQTAASAARQSPCWLEVPGVHYRQTRVERDGVGAQETVKWFVSGYVG